MMLTDRLEEIKTMLLSQKRVFVSDLSKHFNISEVTARKDLAVLERMGLAIRFHGGATLNLEQEIHPIAPVDDFYSNDILLSLADKACAEINDGDSIFLGSGRTCSVLAKQLLRFDKLSVVTNNVSAIKDLSQKNFTVFLIGGEVTSADGMTLFSSLQNTSSYLTDIFVDKSFTSITGIDINVGLTVNSIISTYLYKAINEITNHWYVLADHTKFDRIAMYAVEKDISKVDCFITDKLSQKYEDYFARHQIAHK